MSVRTSFLSLTTLITLVFASACEPEYVIPPLPDSGPGVDGGFDAGMAEPMCDNLERDGDETSVDCGGSCPPCANGDACIVSDDCESLVCDRGRCLVPNCMDGVRNGDETGADCGGDCGLCPGGEPCSSNDQCISGRCVGGMCAMSSCDDGNLNADETDVDCGGPLCPPCEGGADCDMDSDCSSAICAASMCTDAACDDGVQNQDETSVDCGGATCSPCADGLACIIDSDCTGMRCFDGGCVSCVDMIMDAEETDVDCGGGLCPDCADGLMCVASTDCVSDSCVAGVCESCTDGTMNQDETDADCGGAICPACAVGLMCTMASDCLSTICDSGTSLCNAPGCGDGAINGAETDLDCGGGSCLGCANGLMCLLGRDCLSGICTGGTCTAPSCTDGVQNGGESDVDCGGATACPRCPDFRRCTLASDCVTAACTSGFCGTMACGPPFLRINELHGGDGPGFDYVEIINTGSCPVDISGVEIATAHNCTSSPLTRFTFPAGSMLAGGGIARARDTTGGLLADEYYSGPICWDAGNTGWTAICTGACDLTTCANFLDYQEQNDVAGRADGAPTCATFTPAPFDVSSITSAFSSDAVHRVAFSGSGSAGVATDWAISMYTR